MQPVITLFLFLFSTHLFAQSVGTVSYGGTGCPQGTLSQSYQSRSNQLSLNFRQFSVRSGTATGKTLDRQSCLLTVPVNVPSGYQMAIATEARGQANIRTNGLVTLTMETFYTGSTSAPTSKTYRPGQQVISIGSLSQRLAWSPCGESTNLRMNLSAVTQNNASALMRQMNVRVYYRTCTP